MKSVKNNNIKEIEKKYGIIIDKKYLNKIEWNIFRSSILIKVQNKKY